MAAVDAYYKERGIFQGRFGFGKHAALIVIDMSYGWTDAAYAGGSARLDRAIAAIALLLPAVRAKAIPIAYTTSPWVEGPQQLKGDNSLSSPPENDVIPVQIDAGKTGGQRNALYQTDARTPSASGMLPQQGCGTSHQVVGVCGEFWSIAPERDCPGGILLEHQGVVQANADHEGFQLMVTVRSFREHFQVEIHLGRCPDHEVVGVVRDQHRW